MTYVKRAVLPLVSFAVLVLADSDMDMDEERPEFHPINAGSKAFHWILTLIVLLIIPSISTSLAFANRLHWSLLLQYVSTGYSIFESLFLDFPDNKDNHENRTSKGTSCPTLKSQEFYDSTVMMLWGVVNTFTEHRWGQEPWNMGDYQHTAMGIIWWAGGLLGMYLSRNNRRSFVPALLLIFTGWSMSQHSQHSVLSTKVHALFGIALMSAGVTRIIETAFLLKDKACSESGKILTFQYLPPFGLTLSGILFMSATEEQLQLVHDLGSDHSAYILIVSGAAFLIFLWIQLCLWLYLRLVGYDEDGELNKSYAPVSIEEFELGDITADEEEENDTPPDEEVRESR
ncbi:hypothetical protein KGF57_005193 [Candida theae]|uniref:Protein YTP1-like C-terminal domain-containing protein n=1 Tax=Candida theae TaxID=1198502 RepID=A0AAD5B9D4_9ASCO|nr:uncharacterized protein KGF57_005193 [Candida theae]KAI5948795.1 hypothetical protein KGF57_005193 [Candida theae]